jgi:hypothetical protein
MHKFEREKTGNESDNSVDILLDILWLEKSFIIATITLEHKVADQVCVQVSERKIEAVDQACIKVKASKETALALAVHAEHDSKYLEDECIVLKTNDEVEQRMDNKTKRKLQKSLRA